MVVDPRRDVNSNFPFLYKFPGSFVTLFIFLMKKFLISIPRTSFIFLSMNLLPFNNLPPHKPRSFVPANIDLSDWNQIAPLYDKLEARVATWKCTGCVEQWLLDWSELGAALDQDHSERYIAMTC